MKRRSSRGAVTLIRRLRSHVVILLALASVTGGWWFQRLDFPAEPKPTSIDYPGFTVANHGSDVAVAITFIAVVSMQRSSSTFLSHQVLAGEEESEKLARTPISACPLHHFISLNEIFQTYEQQSGDAWSIEGKELLNGGQRKVFDLTALELVDFLQRVAKRKCRQQIARDRSRSETSTRLESCPKDNQAHKHHCFVNFKQFDGQLTLEQHKQVWKSLPDLRIIVLERDIEERWKSWWYAQKTGDWDVSGSNGHKERIANSQPPDIPSSFRDRHERWYSRVRELTGRGGSLGHIPSLDVSFSSVVSDPVGMRKQAMQMFLLLEPTQPPLAAEKKVGDSPTTSKEQRKPKTSNKDTEQLEVAKMSSYESKSSVESDDAYYYYYEETSEGTKTRIRGSLFTPTRQFQTGAYANCATTSNAGERFDPSVGVESGTVTVSCNRFRYRLVEASFRRAGPILAGVLSSARAVERRKVSWIRSALSRERWTAFVSNLLVLCV